MTGQGPEIPRSKGRSDRPKTRSFKVQGPERQDKDPQFQGLERHDKDPEIQGPRAGVTKQEPWRRSEGEQGREGLELLNDDI